MIFTILVDDTIVFKVIPNGNKNEIKQLVTSKLEEYQHKLEDSSNHELEYLCQAIKPFYVSITDFTGTCYERCKVRYNPIEGKIGVPLSWEMKTLFFRGKKDEIIHVIILRGDCEIEEHLKETNNVDKCFSEDYGSQALQSGQVTPISINWMLKYSDDRNMVKYYMEKGFEDIPYITNNIASNKLSVTMEADDYINIVEDVINYKLIS